MGWRCLKGPFGNLRLPLPPDCMKRKNMLLSCAHLLNLRTRCCGLNQVRSVYQNENEKSQPWVERFIVEQEAVDFT